MNNFMTDFGANIDRKHPLPLHPNPLFQRDSFLSLNGEWEFAINREKGNIAQYDQTILVPFAPETPLSGIQRSPKSGEYLHYRRKIELPDAYVNHDILLHLDAVDQICDVFWNGHFVAHHEGGYFPLEVHLTCVGKEDVIEVVVVDDTDSAIFARGKQSREPGGVWYTPTSGIWQSVWLEPVPDDGYIQSIKVDPLFDEQKVKISAKFIGNKAFANAECFFKGQLIAKGGFSAEGELTLDLSYEFFPWSPNEPNLYELTITAGYDSVHSYFAMRKVSTITLDGFHLFALNNHPYFLSGVLDQGYYPESGLTAPSEEAMVNDLMLLKQCGYNTVRKHIKIEPMRWYYQCDRLGLLVCQDFVNGGSRYSSFLIHVRPFFTFDISDKQNKQLGRLLAASRSQFLADMKTTIDHLYNVPSIVIWTIFNEGWGQFDTDRVTAQVRELDATRLLDSSSGWYDKKVGDFKSEHIYFWYFLGLHNDRKRILALTEFGGYSLTVPHHVYSDTSFGYYYCRSFQSFNDAVMRLYRRRILSSIERKGLSEAIFTQLSDVEEEQNGLITYDRKVVKIDTGAMKEMNKELYRSFERKFGKME